MSSDKSAQSINTLAESSSESDKIQSKALNESSSTITAIGLEENVDKNEDATMKLDMTATENSRMTIPDSAAEFKQWLQSMLSVARLPGGLPTEFRRKLWLGLAERYLKRRNVNWEVEKVKWLSENHRADDEELGTQIVKDLHRTGHSLLSGASGKIYQAKLKQILMGYTRWNPEVGYCQGFNMLGAIILQVMDKSEVDSIKVMIFLIEGLLPNGYFCGGLLGLQADMAVFRELLGYKLPKLARHLQKLQNSTNEPSFEPPIINVFTMQWFLTLFCNCLPMSYVLRIWDLIMIEGSDILLRTALSIWKILEDRILKEVRTADDFYCKMGSLSAGLLNGSLIDSNRLIHMIGSLGPINDLQQLRQKHLTASFNDQKKLKMLYSSAESDESRQAVANAWASRRGSQPTKGQTDREKIALDITILKKQYDKLRERQKQAHIILTSAVSKQHQQQKGGTAGPSTVNKLLVGKNAIISKGRKGPPKGAIPPARNQKYVKHSRVPSKQSSKPDETVQWNDTDEAKKRRNSMTWKELKAENRAEDSKKLTKSSSASSLGSSNSKVDVASPSKRRSDSSSYSEDSDCESSTSTSLCDDDITSSLEASPMKKKRHKDLPLDVSMKPLNKIEEVSPTAPDVIDCPAISVSDPDGETKTLSPITNFFLDLSPASGAGDITSISQLSPMPDLTSYFTAISPIKTPCNYFQFPDLSFIMNTDDKYQVNDEGVTNEFFERVFEENVLSSNNALPSPSDNNIQSFSPLILKDCDMEEETKPLELGEGEINFMPTYIKQKSLSMDEQSCDRDEFISINRSFSDGTIINVDCMDSDGIIAMIEENLKILNQIIPVRPLPEDDASDISNIKLNIDAVIIDEPKSPTNLSDVEEEIAAIDIVVDDADEAKEGILLSDIQDLANIKVYLDEKHQHSMSTSLTCNTYQKEENVTEKNEKSINEENGTTLATLICSPLENKSDAEGEGYDLKATAVAEVQPKAEARRQEKSVSPKFNEIQLMVTKLKEEMESQLNLSESEVIHKEEKETKKEEIKNSDNDERVSEEKLIVEEKNEKAQKAPELAVESAVKIEEKVSEEPVKEVEVKVDVTEVTKVSEVKAETKITCSDLEKKTSEQAQKIDKSDSEKILEKLNTQLDSCQKQPTKEIPVSKENEGHMPASNKSLEKVSAVDINELKSDSVHLEVKLEGDKQDVVSVSAPTPVEPEAKKDSNEILEKLNIQLQRCEEKELKMSRKKMDMSGSIYNASDKSVYDKSAVMELAVLIKERELEKLSEQKLLMKSSKDFDLSLSPVRTPRSRSNLSSPEPPRDSSNEKFSNYYYDHEPRSDIRRRDVNTLETEQRMRRPFKSSPTSSLSASPSNISNTLSSIQNTIKILDSACSKTDVAVVSKTKVERAMENIDKMCDTDKDWKYYKQNRYESSPSFRIDDMSIDSQPKRRTYIDDDVVVEKSFDLSPRRKRYDYDIGETSFKTSKDSSPTSRFSKTPEIDPDYVAKLKYLSTEEYIAGRKSPLGGSRETLLDTKFKIDRSPTSPVLSMSTHISRSPRSPSHDSSLLRFPSNNDIRSSKSAEHSPSRYSSERADTSSYKYNSTSGKMDSRADSLSNLSYKSSSSKKYDYEWETPSTTNKKYDYHRN